MITLVLEIKTSSSSLALAKKQKENNIKFLEPWEPIFLSYADDVTLVSEWGKGLLIEMLRI